MSEEKAKSERPPDSDFQQQNLKAWQPLLTPGWVIGTFALIGIIFLPIGIVILDASENVVQVEARYDNVDDIGGKVSVTMTVPDDMEAPIYFYYKLVHFYQNHRRYVKSRNDAQLRGEKVTDLSSCSPLQKFEGKDMYPCGLIANSYFNDNFSNPVLEDNSKIEWTDKGIAWPSDVEKKFKKGDYDPATMIDHGPSNVTLDHTKEDFIVWMRTAGLPTFKKLRYIIKTDLSKGAQLTFNIDSKFEVKGFGGEKWIVLSTTSWLGGKNEFLGYAYITVASLCLLLAIVFGVKHKVSPRPLGDMRYFNWHGARVDST